MTARPIDPESRRRPLRTAVVLVFVMVAVLLAAGCDETPNKDIVVVKLTPNATLSWSKVIDTGDEDTAEGIISTSDGGFVISARLYGMDHQQGRYPYLIKFSHDGNFVWNRSTYELNCDYGTLTNNPNGEIITVAGNDSCRFNSDGELISNETIIHVGGISYHSLREYGFTNAPTSVIELKNKRGYIVVVQNQSYRPYSVLLDLNKSFINATPLETLPDITPSAFRDLQWEYKDIPGYAMPHNVVFFNPEGDAVARQILYNTSSFITQTEDGGYVSAGFPSSSGFLSPYTHSKATEGNLHLTKLFPNGTLQWDMVIPNITANEAVGITQTSDGGYAILCEDDKIWPIRNY
jgi:hypothetical protein